FRAGELGGVDHSDRRAGGGIFVRADNDWRGGIFFEQRGNHGPDAIGTDFAASVPDATFGGDGEQDGLFVEILRTGGARLRDLHAGFLYEYRGDDEENQQQEDHIDQRRNVDRGGRFAGGGMAEASHAAGSFPSS